ncbi:hypothetical protein RHMOL_Rhmol09G0017800 [Rhododendron molle]|uniref:Uncharacterized protein n=1 Tax=Rhododendron molle TaxID=49168 RepID=A0ACC0MAL6_RHOML|nr:hypothetical protein RHMOL_Rhmol09G0017800 [Rhododendron molle]
MYLRSFPQIHGCKIKMRHSELQMRLSVYQKGFRRTDEFTISDHGRGKGERQMGFAVSRREDGEEVVVVERKAHKDSFEEVETVGQEEMSRRQRRAHRKCREELNKVDWEMMKKHLHTPEALQAYEKLCNLARKKSLIKRLASSVGG